MPREYLANLLYEKCLISIPMVFDLLNCYGQSNQNTLRHLVNTLFSIEPRYKSDLADSLRFLRTSFDKLCASINDSDPDTYDDLAIQILDYGHTVHALLAILSDTDAVYRMCREIKLEQRITRFYDDDIPNLLKNIKLITPQSESLKYLMYARYEMLKFFRCLIDKCLMDIMLAE